MCAITPHLVLKCIFLLIFQLQRTSRNFHAGVNVCATLSLKVHQPCPLCSCVCMQCAKSQSGPDLAVLPHIPKQYTRGPAPTDLVEHVFYF